MKHPQPTEAKTPNYHTLYKLARSTGEATVTVPATALRQMLEDYEDLLDVLAFDTAKHKVEEAFPSALVARLVAGEPPLKLYREYRGLTQQALADLSGTSREMIAMIETGKKRGSITTVKKLAAALKVGVEDL